MSLWLSIDVHLKDDLVFVLEILREHNFGQLRLPKFSPTLQNAGSGVTLNGGRTGGPMRAILAALVVLGVGACSIMAEDARRERQARNAVERASGAKVYSFQNITVGPDAVCGKADGVMFVWDGRSVEFSPEGRGFVNLRDAQAILEQAAFVGRYADCMEAALGRYPR